MKPPVRMVCGDCLRSLEIQLEEPGTLPMASTCPYCGGTIDSQLSEMGTRTSDQAEPIAADEIPGLSKHWSETWIRGTLGTLGRFQLRELLGDGGFGQVFQAYDPRLDRDVALKVLRQSDPGERVMQRFFREARAAARLEHPNIVAVYDAGSEDGRCWIAYQFVKGMTLLRQHDQQRLDLVAIVRLIRDLADALDHAHRQGVYHRDLKPSNIIVDAEGRPHLTDFGLARRADLDSDLTRDGTILGTPLYMSPEQADGRSNLADGRSDVYSLGVIFFELLCGRRPNNLPSQAPLWVARPVEPPPSLRSFDRSIPPAIDRICRRTLAINPAQRYPDARALRDELDFWVQRRHDPTRLSHPLACVLMGIAAGLLLIVGLKAVLAPSGVERPPVVVASLKTPMNPASHAMPPRTGIQEVRPEAVEAAPNPRRSSHPIEAVAKVAPPARDGADHRKPFIANRNRSSMVLHARGCKSLEAMNSSNWVEFETAAAAVELGYTPCRNCKPHDNVKRLPGLGNLTTD